MFFLTNLKREDLLFFTTNNKFSKFEMSLWTINQIQLTSVVEIDDSGSNIDGLLHSETWTGSYTSIAALIIL